ncbi:MAG TPA: ABC transporter substrate-binding protein [Gammaproteobacteria bacterium]|nr:ABC transporter substrate-binding protein [Gammaproteobacteria bacterium]
MKAPLPVSLLARLVSIAGVVLAACGGPGPANELRIPTGAGGVGFLPLLVMKDQALVEKHARALGIDDVVVRWIDLGGPAVMNDALLSGSVDFIAAGPPAFITLWDRTRDSAGVKGVAAMTSLPMYLNTAAEHLRKLEDLTEQDKIAVTAIKVSIPAIAMQMYAAERYGADEAGRFDRYTVTMTHPDGVIALLSGSNQVNAHFTSPPFHQRELQDPRIRTVLDTNDIMGGSTTFTMLSTTTRFREQNPALYAAVLAALEEANELIRTDVEGAARVLFAADEGAGFSVEKLTEVLRDPDIKFTTTPQNVQKYAEFMHAIGSIQTRPSSWRDLFFPELHDAPGS